MCEVCHMTRCPSGCPNAPEPRRVDTCHQCGEAIIPEDEYAVIDGVAYCESCIDNMPYCELIPLLGGEWKTANEEDVYDGYDG